jgi:hypothetical protein
MYLSPYYQSIIIASNSLLYEIFHRAGMQVFARHHALATALSLRPHDATRPDLALHTISPPRFLKKLGPMHTGGIRWGGRVRLGYSLMRTDHRPDPQMGPKSENQKLQLKRGPHLTDM